MADDRVTTGDDASFDASRLSRRDVLKATAGAGAVAAGVGAGAVGSASGGIPTPWLEVDGNLVKTEAGGETVKLRGLNVADPKRIDVTAPARGKTAEQVVRKLTDPNEGWHPRVIRIPTQPIDIGEHTPGGIDGSPEPPAFTQSELESYLTEYVDPIVDLCEQRGVYCIIDFHRHWKPLEWATGQPVQGEDPADYVNEALHQEVLDYWDVVAPRYADRSHVLYELYNEPTEPGMTADPTDRRWVQLVWETWLAQAQPWVDRIREDADNIVLIGSPMWSQSPEGALYEPFEGENLAYTYHIYPGHNVSRNERWADGPDTINDEGTFGVYEEYPLFVTEFGWDSEIIDNYLRGTTGDFGEPFMDFLESSDGIHWTAWCADPIWLPKMFRLGDWVGDRSFQDSIGDPYSEEIPELCPDLPCEWELVTGENMGGFIKQTLADLKDDGVPSGEFTTPDETPTVTETETGDLSPVGNNTAAPTDPDGDGLYEDVNGNGDGDLADAVDLFQHRDSAAVTDDVSAYDFSGNDEVDLADVVQLFQENTS